MPFGCARGIEDFSEPQPFEREFKGIQKFEPISRSHDGLIDILQTGRNDAEGYFYYVMELADGAASPNPEIRSPKETRNQNTEGAGGGAEVRASSLGLPSDFGLRPSDLYIPHTLRHDLRACGHLPFEECLRLGRSLTSALEHLHQNGLVHRDIKPSNIIFVDARAVGAMYVKLAAGVDQDTRAVIPQAMNMYREVLEIDDTNFEALQSLLSWRLVYEWDWEVMKGEFDQLRRRYPEEHLMWALLYRCLGRTNEARLEQALAEKREPNNLVLRYHGIAARFFERDYPGAFKEASRWPQLTYDNYIILDRCYLETGYYPKALEVIKKARGEYDTPELLGLLGRTYALMGDREKALEVLRDLENRSSTSYIQPYFVAWVHAGLGQTDEVLKWSHRAVQEKSPYLLHPDWGGLRTDPAWDGLRDDPRFHALLKKVGLDVWPK